LKIYFGNFNAHFLILILRHRIQNENVFVLKVKVFFLILPTASTHIKLVCVSHHQCIYKAFFMSKVQNSIEATLECFKKTRVTLEWKCSQTHRNGEVDKKDSRKKIQNFTYLSKQHYILFYFIVF